MSGSSGAQILEAMIRIPWGFEGERGVGQRIVKYLLKSMMVTLFLMLEGAGGNGMVERRKFV